MLMADTRFKEGIDAFERGSLRSACPYRFGSAAFAEWGQGWTAGLRARGGDGAARDARPYHRTRIFEARIQGPGFEDRDALGAPKRW